MKLRKYFVYYLSLLTLFFIPFHKTPAQDTSNVCFYWTNLGGGWSDLGSGASVVGINLQLNNILFTFQHSKHYYASSWLFAKETKEFSDYNLQIGLTTKDTNWHASISTGLSVVSGTRTHNGGLNLFTSSKKETEYVKPLLGFVTSVQLFWKACDWLGLGVELFGNLNRAERLNGFTITIFVGKLY